MRTSNLPARRLYESEGVRSYRRASRLFIRTPGRTGRSIPNGLEDRYGILAISSCDETAAAVVEDGRNVLSSVVASQVEEHKLYGGVVPEIASRRHAEAIVGVVQEAWIKRALR